MRASPGLTVVELVLTIFISTVILTTLLRFIAIGFPLSKVTYLQIRSTEVARLQLGRLAQTLREARPSDTGAYPLVEASPQRLIFYANVDNDSAIERVRYELTGTTLQRGIIKPTGNPLTYNTANEVVSAVASSVRNGSTPLFLYYGGNYPASSTALTNAQLNQITYIQFTLLIDADPSSDPPPLTVQSQVQLRNLKTNLADPAS